DRVLALDEVEDAALVVVDAEPGERAVDAVDGALQALAPVGEAAVAGVLGDAGGDGGRGAGVGVAHGCAPGACARPLSLDSRRAWEPQGGNAASQRPRRAPLGRIAIACVLRQPSPPGDSAAGTARCALRAAVGRSSGSWIRESSASCRGLLALVAASRDHRPSACATSFPPTAAGQRRDGRWPDDPTTPHRLPFSSRALWRGNRRDTTYRGLRPASTQYVGQVESPTSARDAPAAAPRSAPCRGIRGRPRPDPANVR